MYSIKVRAGSAVALDDSRKYVVVHDDQGVRVCAVESGKAVVTLPAIQMPSEATMTAAVFRSDGKQVAILFDTSTSSQLIMWNLASNKAECEMRLPFTARAIAWSGADLLLGSLYSRNSAWFYRGYHPMQRSPSSANYERQYPDPNQLWPPEKLRTVVRVSPSEQRLVWLYSVTEPPGFAGQPMTNYPANLDIVGQTAIDRAWLSLKARTAEQDLVSIGDRTSEEAKAIQQHEMPQINEVKGNEISVVVDVHELPETVVRAAARRAEFQSSLEKSLRKLLADYTLKTAAEKPLMFKATVKELAARDLRAPDGKATLFGKPGTSMSYTVSPNGPNGLGVLARLELRTKTENKERDEEPLWLGEAWFAADTRITANSDVQSELQLLVPWEKAVRWLGERTLPSRSLDSSQFSVAGATELTLRDAAVEVKDGPHE